jgi:hypothetical protein
MNDEFLYRYRQQPRAEFTQALYRRISREPAVPRLSVYRLPVAERVKHSLSLLGFVFVVAYTLSPDIRGRIRTRIVGAVRDVIAT